MRKLVALLLFVCLINIVNAQTTEVEKIIKTLEKHLVGKPFLGGIYDLPCNEVEKISISENGEISFTGAEKGCNVTLFIKDASITLDGSTVKIYQTSPRINKTFYTEGSEAVFKALNDFKKFLNQ